MPDKERAALSESHYDPAGAGCKPEEFQTELARIAVLVSEVEASNKERMPKDEALQKALVELNRLEELRRAETIERDGAVRRLAEEAESLHSHLKDSTDLGVMINASLRNAGAHIGRVRETRKYKVGIILQALRKQPVHGTWVILKWLRGRYAAFGLGLSGALMAQDPLKLAQEILSDEFPSSASPAPLELPLFDPYLSLEPLRKIEIAVEDQRLPACARAPKFSVITTVLNEEGKILEFLRSIELQSLQPDEVVVVDGGSSDTTVGRIAAFQSTAKFSLRLYSEKGASIARGRNIAIRNAINDIVVCVDAGTVLDADLLWNLVGCFDLHPEADLVAGVFYDAHASVYAKELVPDWESMAWETYLPSARSIAFRKQLAGKIGGFPEELDSTGEDTLFVLRYRRISSRWVFSKKAIVRWQGPQNPAEAIDLGYRYGRGDGESGFGDFRFHELFCKWRRGLVVGKDSVWHSSFNGYLSGRNARSEIEIKRRGISGLAIVLSGVPITDSGGGQRGAQFAQEFVNQGFKVVYVNVYPSYEITHRHFFDIDYGLLELYHIEDFDVAETLGRYRNLAGPTVILMEFPHPAFELALKALRAAGQEIHILYDLIDRWETSLGGNWYSAEVDRRFIEAADLLLASSTALEKDLRSKAGRPVKLLPNAVNLRLFDPSKTYARPEDLPYQQPIVFYSGALWGSWFDWDLFQKAVDQLQDYVFVLLGNIDTNRKTDLEKKHTNLKLLGLKSQIELPAYLSYASVCIIPFKSDEITKYVSPLKAYEYLAMNRPIVSTGLAEIAGFPGVTHANDAAEFLTGIRAAIGTAPDCSEFVVANSWSTRVREIRQMVAAGVMSSETRR